MNNDILENSISNIDDDLIEMTAQKLMRTRPRKTALNIVKFAGAFAGIAAAAAALCIAVQLGTKQYNDRLIQSGTVSGSDPASSGAGGTASSSGSANNEALTLNFKAQHIRTTYRGSGKRLLIKSRSELEKYVSDNLEKSDLDKPHSESSNEDAVSFCQAVSGYDEEFFKDHCLLLIVTTENSGSNRLNVNRVKYSPKYDTLIPVIDRIVPQLGTCDMEEWHIIIELDALYGSAQSIEINEYTIEPNAVSPEPDPFFENGGCDYADILEFGYEDILGFKIKNMEYHPDFKKYLPEFWYRYSEEGDVYGITYVFSNYRITAYKYDEKFRPSFLDKYYMEKYDYKGVTFFKHIMQTKNIVFFDEDDVAYYCIAKTPDAADAVRDLIIEIVNTATN